MHNSYDSFLLQQLAAKFSTTFNNNGLSPLELMPVSTMNMMQKLWKMELSRDLNVAPTKSLSPMLRPMSCEQGATSEQQRPMLEQN